MKLLLHTCCAPCSVYCIKALKEENIKPDLQDEFINYMNKKDKYREIKGVQLTRVLRNYLEDRK